MARILAISSHVARGHVGLSAIVPACQALGHDVTALPTINLSNHPGHPHASGERIAPAVLSRMLDALAANGWLADIDSVLTGYLPSAEHVAFAADTIDRIRALSPSVVVFCDAILGDVPKGLYIAPEAAAALRDQLLHRADVLKANAFEIGWLAGSTITKNSHACGPCLGRIAPNLRARHSGRTCFRSNACREYLRLRNN